MKKSLQSIFNTITPDNIKDIPLIRDAMEVFIETLEELSKESIDIRSVYQNEILKEQLVKMYLDDLYNVLKEVQLNEQVLRVVDEINERSGTDFYNKDVIINISKYITEEHFLSFKSYKQHKGTKESIAYIYELISNLISTDEIDSDFRFIEGTDPFTFEVEGGLPSEIYEYIIYPLAHPVGFTYKYTRYISLKLEDYFPGLSVEYNTRQLEVRSLFPDGSTEVTKYIDRLLSEQQQEALGLDPDLEVINLENIQEGTLRIRNVYLNNGTYLRQETTDLGQTTVFLYNDDDTLIKQFDGQASIYLDYTPIFNTTVTDELYSKDVVWKDDNVSRLSLENVNRYFNIEITKIENKRFYSTEAVLTSYNDPELDTLALNADQDGNVDVTDYLISKGYVLYNELIDDNGDYIPEGSGIQGRLEIYRETKPENDLKLLKGQYIYDYNVFDQDGNFVHFQHLKYTQTVNQTPTTDVILSIDEYNKQNIENTGSLAKEHQTLTDNKDLSGVHIMYELVHPGPDVFVDYNNENVDIPNDHLMFVNDAEVDGDIKEVGNVYFIGEVDLFLKYQGEDTRGLIQPEHMYFTETIVAGETVNLQWETRDDVFDFGVYRNGVLLEDNNVSAIQD